MFFTFTNHLFQKFNKFHWTTEVAIFFTNLDEFFLYYAAVVFFYTIGFTNKLYYILVNIEIIPVCIHVAVLQLIRPSLIPLRLIIDCPEFLKFKCNSFQNTKIPHSFTVFPKTMGNTSIH